MVYSESEIRVPSMEHGMEIELASLDLRYEGHRLRDRAGEARLLTSMAERGIADPLEGVEQTTQHVLLNGFKRCRCARLLGLTSVPYQSMGEDAAMGIVALLRASNDRALGILEQASFVGELKCYLPRLARRTVMFCAGLWELQRRPQFGNGAGVP